MGLFSSIGKALGSVAKAVIPAVGTFFGGPVGGVVGSVLGGAMDTLDQNVGPIVGGAAQYFSAQDVANQNKENLATQQQYNVSNAATANAFTEKMFGQQVDANTRFMQAQQGENRYLVDQALAFEREMSGTAYQRATADMRAAGINPMVSYTQGGASTPNAPTGSAAGGSVGSGSGAMASSSVLPGVDKIGSALTTAVTLRAANQALENAKEQEQLTQAQRWQTHSSDHLLNAQRRLTDEQIHTEKRRAANIDADTLDKMTSTVQRETGLPGIRDQNRIIAREAEDTEAYGTSTLGRNIGGLDRILQTLWKNLRGAQ